MGLLKRGLGGISIEDTGPIDTSMYLRNKIAKSDMYANVGSLNTEQTEMRSYQKTLKPKLWNRSLIHKAHQLAKADLVVTSQQKPFKSTLLTPSETESMPRREGQAEAEVGVDVEV